MGFRQIFGGSTAPKYLTEPHPSNIWGLYTPKIFDERGSVKYFGGSTAPKCLTEGVPSNIRGLYTPKIFDRTPSIEYLVALHPQNISRMGFRQIFGGSTAPKYLTQGVRQIFGGSTPPKYLTEPHSSNICGDYTPKIFDGWGSVKFLGGL